MGLMQHAPGDLGDVEITAGQFAPMSAREHTNALQVRLADLGLEPFCSFGQFSPKRTMADEQQSSSRSILRGIAEVWCVHEPARYVLIFLELRTAKIVLQEFGDHFVFGYALAQSDKSRENIGQSAASSLHPIRDDGESDEEEQHDHGYNLYPDDLCQRLMECIDTGDDETADYQLQPSRIRDLARHLVRDHHHAQGVDSRGSRIQQQQIREVDSAFDPELPAEEPGP